jgi:hypothetical protein
MSAHVRVPTAVFRALSLRYLDLDFDPIWSLIDKLVFD